MITSAGYTVWPLDIPISDLTSAGLPVPSLVRMKLFTLDDILVVRRIGILSSTDKNEVQNKLKQLFVL